MSNVKIAAMLTLALFLPVAGASAADALTGDQIRDTVSDHTVSGNMLDSGPYAEFYQADGMIKGDGYTGAWSIESDAMCFEYDGEAAGCWQLGMQDGMLMWIQDGKVLGDGTAVPGNPNGFWGRDRSGTGAGGDWPVRARMADVLPVGLTPPLGTGAVLAYNETSTQAGTTMSDIIRIEYCRAWNYEPRALRARDQLQKAHGVEVEIKGGRTGSFEITRGGEVLFSKLAEHRFPEDAELLHLLDPRWGGPAMTDDEKEERRALHRKVAMLLVAVIGGAVIIGLRAVAGWRELTARSGDPKVPRPPNQTPSM